MTRLRAVKLSPADPHSALRKKARQMPARRAEVRHLTEQQLKNPLLRKAHQRLSSIVTLRGKYLRRLDTVNGDRRTRLEKFTAIERVSEQMLVRLDLATSVLGFIDVKNGQFVLNTQRGIAEDSGVSEPILSRLLSTMESAGYVYRRIERVRLDEKDEAGLHLVRTRVLVRFTKLFWADLGLLYVFERVQKSAKKRRDIELAEISQRRLAEMERYSLVEYKRELSRNRWQAKVERDARGSPQKAQSQPEPGTPEAPDKNTGNDVLAKLSKLLDKVSRSSG